MMMSRDLLEKRHISFNYIQQTLMRVQDWYQTIIPKEFL